MAQEAQSFSEMLKKFGSDLGLPKVDIEKLMATHAKNFEALGEIGSDRVRGRRNPWRPSRRKSSRRRFGTP